MIAGIEGSRVDAGIEAYFDLRISPAKGAIHRQFDMKFIFSAVYDKDKCQVLMF